MPEANFEQRKSDVLKKGDKSSVGKWDEKIEALCGKINRKTDYYTTSSCSGRALLMVDKPAKDRRLSLWVSHDRVRFNELNSEIRRVSKEYSVKFKVDPPIIHVICRDFDSARKLLDAGFGSGWKNSGAISMGKNIVIELRGTEKLELPVIDNGRVPVSQEPIKLLAEKSNLKIKKGWKLIRDLSNLVSLL
jgi:tRNA wybutosine-synthesizing protein 3